MAFLGVCWASRTIFWERGILGVIVGVKRVAILIYVGFIILLGRFV